MARVRRHHSTVLEVEQSLPYPSQEPCRYFFKSEIHIIVLNDELKPAATAAALPPELPPADLSSDVPIGFTTGPWTEWMCSDLGRNVSAGGGIGRPRVTPSRIHRSLSISAPDCCNSFTTVAPMGEIYSAKYRFSGEAWIIESNHDYFSIWQTNKSLETMWLRCYPLEQLRHQPAEENWPIFLVIHEK